MRCTTVTADAATSSQMAMASVGNVERIAGEPGADQDDD
jgi:hypothetical protein